MLHYQQYGAGEPLVILHGLFGSSKNWQSLAKQFSESFSVYTVDLRNHGLSFHDDEMNYSVMTDDVYKLLGSLGLSSCNLLGHSMGGKVAMILANNNPDIISRLVVADIAPLAYKHDHNSLLEPIMALSLADIDSRAAADAALKPAIPDPMLRGFLLQNLAREGDSWRWKVNWSAIKQHMSDLTDFPISKSDWLIEVPTLFLRGENSDYIGTDEATEIENHFSNARIETIRQAGHWLHAEQPQKFLCQVSDFLC